ncbi:hypothetical protein L1049_016105 [Liquidambar formosana]|uniref:E3 ubiquitin-protein ligase LIN-1 n=1 Tax=Liquidambar formosana TaxID=63359 RepID=A0AAP0RZ60_LIQFO
MFHNSMAPISFSPSSASSSNDHDRIDIESIRVLVILINKHILELLANPITRNSVRLRCTSKLKIQKQEFFEFSEHSVISNLYWGIESIEFAVQVKASEEKTSRLKNCERMLQVPALLDEDGVTAGIPNSFLVCCSYFYLSVVRKLQRDELQVALHFLQALLVSPRLVWTEFAPELCESLFASCSVSAGHEGGRRRSLESVSRVDFGEDEIGVMTKIARRYKDRLMYYQVMLYGETPQWDCKCRDIRLPDDDLRYFKYRKSSSTESSNSVEQGNSLRTYNKFEKVHPMDPLGHITDEMTDKAKAFRDISEFQDYGKASKNLDQVCNGKIKIISNMKCIQDVLKESQSDTPISVDSYSDFSAEEDDLEANADDAENSITFTRINADDPQAEICDQFGPQSLRQKASCSVSNSESTTVSVLCAPGHPMFDEANEVNSTNFFSGSFHSSISDSNLSILELGDNKSHAFWNCHIEDTITQRRLEPYDFQLFNHIPSSSLQNYRFTRADHQGSAAREQQDSRSRKILDEVHPEKDSCSEVVGILEKAISRLCFSESLGKHEDYPVEVTAIYEVLKNKIGVKYNILKDVILDQLLTAISTSKEEGIIRASVSILTTIVSGNKSAIEDIKKKGLRLCDLANALKRNVHEAAILIYLINPSPTEIKTLELLPTLVEVLCTSNNYKGSPASLVPTPPAASLMIIEVLVTAFDSATNNKHLAEINSPQVLSGLLDVARDNNPEEFIALATILVKCMRFDGQCRKHVAQLTPVAPFICLLRSNKARAKCIALEFFHEILRMPRSSAISVLQQVQREGSLNIMHILMPCLQQFQPEYTLLAANLLLQLDMLEDSSTKSIYREEALKVLLESVASEECSATQLLSAFILSNLGGTYAWTGESYTVAWLVKKAGLTSLYHRNVIRNFDWLDQSLQDAGIDTWCSKIARSIIKIGNPVFYALEKGLKSNIKKVSRDCLTAVAWLGYEIAKSPSELRYSACEILLSGIEQFLHPGFELEERLLACLCIYNYASGKGMQKLMHFSEGVRESLRRLSNITWMAEELLKVADYFLPNKARISCVHTQILEAGQNCSGAVSALIYYKGQLYSGYSDGSIKVSHTIVCFVLKVHYNERC